jgi:AcrR family transcriptional regulator
MRRVTVENGRLGRVRPVRREQQILAAAENLFFERGFDATGVDAIAEQAGITGGAIYRHFAGKDEILAVLFDQAIDATLERLTPLTDDPDRDLRNLIAAHVEFAISHPKLAGIWNREQRALADPYRRGYLRRERRYIERWRTCLTRRFPDRDLDEIATAMRAIHALMLSESTRPPEGRSTKNVEALLVDMTVRSLQALEADAD